MHLVWRSREEWLLALGCGVWTAGFLVQERPALYVVPALVVLGVLALRRVPASAALGVAAALLIGSLLGVPGESPAGLAPELVAVYSVGRYTTRRRGAPVVLVFVLVATYADALAPATAVFALFVFGWAWAFGRLVRRRTDAARRARDTAVHLAAEDPGTVTARVVSEERSRLAGDAVAVVRSAVLDMQHGAARAECSLEPAQIEAIQLRGGAAVTELRRLLGLLRAEREPDTAAAGVPEVRRPWRVDLMTAVAVAVVGAADVLLVPGNGDFPLSIVLTMMLYATLALRRTVPAAACLAAAVPMSASLVLQTPTTQGYGEAIALALLAWTAAVAGERWSWAALTALAGVALLASWLEGAGNVAIVAALFALPAFAGHAWSEREREQRAAEQRAAVLRERLEAEVARAVTAERLRIARELHDVTSHAVGVMVLQAGAAQALREKAAEDAREALRAVQAAGAQALSELSVLLGVLDAGALGTTGVASAGAEPLESALSALAARIRATGVGVELRLEASPADPAVAAAVFRVVQEALTNAARHAPGSQVRVRTARGADQLEVEVCDDGPSLPETTGAGFGLVGLAERVRSIGGELSAGPRPAGGFAVAAWIPDPDRVPGGRADRSTTSGASS